MFALAFGLLLAFGLQGQFASIPPTTDPGSGGGGGGGAVGDFCINQTLSNNGKCFPYMAIQDPRPGGSRLGGYTCTQPAPSPYGSDCNGVGNF